MAQKGGPAPGVGLQNQGATCYLNSLLQTLFHLDCFRTALYTIPKTTSASSDVSTSDEEGAGEEQKTEGRVARPERRKKKDSSEDKESEKRTIIEALQRLFFRLQQPDAPPQTTMELTKAFGWDGGDVRQQQDVGEANRMLLDLISEKLKKIGKDDFVKSLFCGSIERCIRAVNIPPEIESKFVPKLREEEVYEVHLIVKGHSTFEEAMLQHLEPESISGFRWEFDEEEDAEDRDGKKDAEAAGGGDGAAGTVVEQPKKEPETAMVDIEVARGFKTLPSILTVHLTRFDYDPEVDRMVKIATPLEFPVTFDASKYLAESSPEHDNPPGDNDYVLYATLIHRGNIAFGHYFCYICRDPSAPQRVWQCYNDDHVSFVDEADVLANGAGITRPAAGGAWGGAYAAQPVAPPAGGAYGSSTNAYMLVYLRRRDIPNIIYPPHRKQIAEPPAHLVAMLRSEAIFDAQEEKKYHEKALWAQLLISTAGMCAVGHVPLPASITEPPSDAVEGAKMVEVGGEGCASLTARLRQRAASTALVTPAGVECGTVDQTLRKSKRSAEAAAVGSLNTPQSAFGAATALDSGSSTASSAKVPRFVELMVRRTTTLRDLKTAVVYRLLRVAGVPVPPPAETMCVYLNQGGQASAPGGRGVEGSPLDDDSADAQTPAAAPLGEKVTVSVPWLQFCGPPVGWSLEDVTESGWAALASFGLSPNVDGWRLWSSRPFTRHRPPLSDLVGVYAGMAPLAPCYIDEALYMEALPPHPEALAAPKPPKLPPSPHNVVPLEAFGVRPDVNPFHPFLCGLLNSYTGVYRWAVPLALFPPTESRGERFYSAEFGGWGDRQPGELLSRPLTAHEVPPPCNAFRFLFYEQSRRKSAFGFFLAAPAVANEDPNYEVVIKYSLNVLNQQSHNSTRSQAVPTAFRNPERTHALRLAMERREIANFEHREGLMDHGHKDLAVMRDLLDPSKGYQWWLPAASMPKLENGRGKRTYFEGHDPAYPYIPCIVLEAVISNVSLARQQRMRSEFGCAQEALEVPGCQVVVQQVTKGIRADAGGKHPLESWFPGASKLPATECAPKPYLMPIVKESLDDDVTVVSPTDGTVGAAAAGVDAKSPKKSASSSATPGKGSSTQPQQQFAPLNIFDDFTIGVCSGARHISSPMELFVEDTAVSGAAGEGPIELARVPVSDSAEVGEARGLGMSTPTPLTATPSKSGRGVVGVGGGGSLALYDQLSILLNVCVFDVTTQSLFAVGRRFYPSTHCAAQVAKHALLLVGLDKLVREAVVVYEDKTGVHITTKPPVVRDTCDREKTLVVTEPPAHFSDHPGSEESQLLRQFRVAAAALCGYGTALPTYTADALATVMERIESLYVPNVRHRRGGHDIRALPCTTPLRLVPLLLPCRRAGLTDGSTLIIQVGTPNASAQARVVRPPPLSASPIDPRRRSAGDVLLDRAPEVAVKLVEVVSEAEAPSFSLQASPLPRLRAVLPADVQAAVGDGLLLRTTIDPSPQDMMGAGGVAPPAVAMQLSLPSSTRIEWVQWRVGRLLGLEGDDWERVRLYCIRFSRVAVPLRLDSEFRDAFHNDRDSLGVHCIGYDVAPSGEIGMHVLPSDPEDAEGAPGDSQMSSVLVDIQVAWPTGTVQIASVPSNATSEEIVSIIVEGGIAQASQLRLGLIVCDAVSRLPVAFALGPGPGCRQEDLDQSRISCVYGCDVPLLSGCFPARPEAQVCVYVVALPEAGFIVRLPKRLVQPLVAKPAVAGNVATPMYDDDADEDEGDGEGSEKGAQGEPTAEAALTNELESDGDVAPIVVSNEDGDAVIGVPDWRWRGDARDGGRRFIPVVVVRTESQKTGLVGWPFVAVVLSTDNKALALARIRATWVAMQGGSAAAQDQSQPAAPWSAGDTTAWDLLVAHGYINSSLFSEDFETISNAPRVSMGNLLVRCDDVLISLSVCSHLTRGHLWQADVDPYRRTAQRTMRVLAVWRIAPPQETQLALPKDKETGIVLKASE